MAAALIRRRQVERQQGVLRPTNLARDLYQLAELVEVCFGPNLDANGRASISEMKALGRLGPLLWLIDLLENVGLGMGRGFVWRIGNRVIGNVSMYSGGNHPSLGPGWLIANVAVHPDHQRQGIARNLMIAAMGLIQQKLHGRWIALEVEANNQAAKRLYDSLGFETFETVNHWESNTGLRSSTIAPPSAMWGVRPRTAGDGLAELELIFNRARIGGMAWTQVLTRNEVAGSLFAGFNTWMNSLQNRAVLPDPAHPHNLLGSAWIEASAWRNARVTLFLDPALYDPAGRQALVRYALRSDDLDGKIVKVETTASDEAVEKLLQEWGFRRVRSLTQMRYVFQQGLNTPS